MQACLAACLRQAQAPHESAEIAQLKRDNAGLQQQVNALVRQKELLEEQEGA